MSAELFESVPTGPLRGPLRKRESHLWTRHQEDWYVEPKWVSERLFAVESFEGRVWDPACGSGRIVLSAKAAGLDTLGTDLVKRTNENFRNSINFLLCDANAGEPNIVSNPPFSIAEKFVAHALALAERKVAMLLPANWVQGDKRSRWLETTPLLCVWFISPRPSMPPGPAIIAGQKPGNGTTDYAWFVWLHGFDGRPEVRWLRRDSKTTSLFAPEAA